MRWILAVQWGMGEVEFVYYLHNDKYFSNCEEEKHFQINIINFLIIQSLLLEFQFSFTVIAKKYLFFSRILLQYNSGRERHSVMSDICYMRSDEVWGKLYVEK